MLAARCDEVTPRRFRAAATAMAPPMVAAAMKSNGFLSDGARIVFKFGDGSLVGGAPGPKLPHKWRRRQRASIVRARRARTNSLWSSVGEREGEGGEMVSPGRFHPSRPLRQRNWIRVCVRGAPRKAAAAAGALRLLSGAS